MNILIFNGSPRRKGNSSKLLNKFSDIATDSGHKVYEVSNIHPCTHCSKCYDTGICTLKDSFESLGIQIPEVDAVVIASPLHYFSMTPKALSFLTRLYPYSLNKMTFGLILSSGSDFEDSGVSIVIDQFKSIDNYCGSFTVYPYHKVTYDKIWDVSELDIEGLKKLLYRLENAIINAGGGFLET